MGAVLGKRLAQIIVTVTNMEKNSVTFWTDSACVLYWIREHSKKLKPFVTNRISKIQMKACPNEDEPCILCNKRCIPTID